MSFIKRLINVFFAPSGAFEAFVEQRDWKDLWIPLIILGLTGLISATILKDLTIDYQLDRIERSIENSERIPEDRKDAILEQQYQRVLEPSALQKILALTSSVLVTPIRVLFLAFLALLVGNLIMGGESKFADMMVLSGYVYLITILEMAVKVPLMLSKWDMEVFTGLGLLGVGEFGDFAYHFLGGIDIFAFWRVVLFGIGMGVIYKKATGPYLIAMTVVWLVLVAISAGLGAAFA